MTVVPICFGGVPINFPFVAGDWTGKNYFVLTKKLLNYSNWIRKSTAGNDSVKIILTTPCPDISKAPGLPNIREPTTCNMPLREQSGMCMRMESTPVINHWDHICLLYT